MKTAISFCFSVFLLLFSSAQAKAAEVDSIYVRAKVGPSFYSNIDNVTSSVGLGLDLGFRSASGWGLAGISTLNFGTTGDLTQNNPYYTLNSTNAKSFFVGMMPSYSVSKGIATLTFGVGVGALSVTTQATYINTNASIDTVSPQTTITRFALAPQFTADFDLISSFFASAGVQYAVRFGTSPQPSFISPMGGVGYRF